MTDERRQTPTPPTSPAEAEAPSGAEAVLTLERDTAVASPSSTETDQAGESAGTLLRQARIAAGLDLDTLASLLKVPVPKLEALEADRHEALPGLAFVRALAQTVCRQLRVDAAPVMARLPQQPSDPQKLENVTRGLATSFREPNTRRIPGTGWLPQEWPAWSRPPVLASAVLLLLALAFWFVPSGRALLGAVPGVAAVGEAASAAVGGLTPGDGNESGTPGAVVETVHSAPLEEEPAASGAQAAVAGTVVLRTSAESWIEARDARGAVLLSRMLLPGETVGLDGEPPVRLKIGNAEGTRLTFHNQPIDLRPYTRDNVARVDLK